VSEDETYTVPRRFAAEILNVSMRTLDRYNRKEKISALRRGRQLFFNEKELLDFKAQILAQQEYEEVQKRRQAPKTDPKPYFQPPQREFQDIERAQVIEQESREVDPDLVDADYAEIRDSLLRRSPEENIFKNLYKKTSGELKEVQTKLEMANYQVGKLETQVKSMVPLLDFKKQKHELLSLAEENRYKQYDINDLERQVKIEQFVKKIYAAFLYFMVALLPLLLILRLFT